MHTYIYLSKSCSILLKRFKVELGISICFEVRNKIIGIVELESLDPYIFLHLNIK